MTAIVLAMLAAAPMRAGASITYQIRLGGAQIGSLERTTEDPGIGRRTVRERTQIRMARGTRSIEMGENLVWTEAQGSGLESFSAERSGFGPEKWTDALTRTSGGWRRIRSRGGPDSIDTLRVGRLAGPAEIDQLFAGSPDSIRIRSLDPTTTEPETYFARFVRPDTLQSLDTKIACRVYVLRDSSGGVPEVLQWRDLRGEVWKEVDPTLGWTSERTELAPKRSNEPELDVMRWIAIPLEGRAPEGDGCALIVERVDPDAPAEPSPPIPDGLDQRVLSSSPGSWRIVRRPPSPIAASAADLARVPMDPDVAEALRPGLIVDAGDPSIRAFAGRAVVGSVTREEEAHALVRAVHDAIRVRDLGTVLGTASQTLRDGRGDCTEHAVLLAACCRARGIPARLVAGIVPNGDQMSFHLWTEVHLDAWVALDATRGGSGSIDPCAVALQRWTQPEDALAGFQVSLERLTAGYRFRFAED